MCAEYNDIEDGVARVTIPVRPPPASIITFALIKGAFYKKDAIKLNRMTGENIETCGKWYINLHKITALLHE